MAITRALRFALALALCPCAVAQRGDPIPEERLKEVLALVEREYVRAVPPDLLAAVTREHSLESLDPYSMYLGPAAYAQFDRELHGAFGGIGIRLDENETNGGFRVSGALWHSPALAAGVRAGDVIVAIDGWATKGGALDAVRARLQGAAGSSVTLETTRDGSAGRRRVPIVRAIIPTSSLLGVRRDATGEWDFMLETGGAAYVRITCFSETTVADFDAAMKEIEKEGATGLVIDLRGNSGGLTDSAITIADRLLDAGRIVTFRSRSPDGERAHDATPGVRFSAPLALLVSPETVSSAELFAAALQDNHRAVVIGARTYGKGMVQKIFPLDGNGGALKLTIARYERPSGIPIERHAPGGSPELGGVWPDPGMTIAVSDEQWTQWNRALEESDALATLASSSSGDSSAEPESPLNDDPALEKALAVLSSARAKAAAAK